MGGEMGERVMDREFENYSVIRIRICKIMYTNRIG